MDRFGEIDPVDRTRRARPGAARRRARRVRPAVGVLPDPRRSVPDPRAGSIRRSTSTARTPSCVGDCTTAVPGSWSRRRRGCVIAASCANAAPILRMVASAPDIGCVRWRHSPGRRGCPGRSLEMVALTLTELVVGLFTGRFGQAWKSLGALLGLVPRTPALGRSTAGGQGLSPGARARGVQPPRARERPSQLVPAQPGDRHVRGLGQPRSDAGARARPHRSSHGSLSSPA